MLFVETRIELLDIVSSPRNVLSYLRDMGVLIKKLNCSKCKKPMKNYLDSSKNEYFFRCSRRLCNYKKESVRKNSVFSKIKTSISKILLTIYEWSQFTPLKQIKKEYKIGLKVIHQLIDCFKSKFDKIKKQK